MGRDSCEYFIPILLNQINRSHRIFEPFFEIPWAYEQPLKTENGLNKPV